MVLVRDSTLDGKQQLVEGMRKAWKRGFNGSELNPELWTVLSKGAGQTITVASGSLTVNLGTGIDEETVIRSVARFQIPLRVQFNHLISQRIANNEIHLELVNAAGDTYVGWLFDGTTTTLARTKHQNAGFSAPASPTGTITVSGSSAVTPTIREIDARIDMVEFNDRASDSNAVSTSRATKTRSTLDPYEDYYIQMRFKNVGGIAPASATTSSLESVLVQDTNDVLVELSGARGTAGLNKSLAVNVLSVPTTSVNPSASSTSGTALSAYRNVSLVNASSTIKSSAGKLMGILATNSGASNAYLNVYNSTAPTIGTTTPIMQIMVPAGQSIDFEQPFHGVNFTTGITCAATDTSTALSNVAPSTPLVVCAAYI